MSRLVLPSDRRPTRSLGLAWCLLGTVLPSIGIALAHRPFEEDHVGLLLGAVIAGGFVYWTIGNLASGVYTSRQGIYSRADAPVRYWIHTLLVAAGTALMVVGWLHQVRAVTQLRSESQPASVVSDLETSERVAIEHLNDADRAIYLKQRPLHVIRERFLVSQYSLDEFGSELLAVQRTTLGNRQGWRMVMVGSHKLLVFHVTDEGELQAILREDLKDSIRRIGFSDEYGPFPDSTNAEEGGAPDGSNSPN